MLTEEFFGWFVCLLVVFPSSKEIEDAQGFGSPNQKDGVSYREQEVLRGRRVARVPPPPPSATSSLSCPRLEEAPILCISSVERGVSVSPTPASSCRTPMHQHRPRSGLPHGFWSPKAPSAAFPDRSRIVRRSMENKKPLAPSEGYF